MAASVKNVTKLVRRAVGLPESSAGLREQIEGIRTEGRAALDEAAQHDAARLTAESFEVAQEFERKAAAARWRAERVQARLPELEARFTAARAREQAEALERHQKLRQALYRRLRDAVIACGEIQAEAIRADQAAVAELGENLVRRHLPAVVFRGLVMPDLVELWTKEMDRVVLNAARPTWAASENPIEWYQGQNSKFAASQPPPAPPKRKAPRMGENVAVGHYGTTASSPLESQGFAKRNPDDTAPLKDGNVRVRVVREGYPDSDGRYSHAGRTIQIPRVTAEAAAKNGAVEILP